VPTRHWDVIDWCAALALTALAELQLALFQGCCERHGLSWTACLLTAAQALPVAWRRRLPLPLLLVSGGAAFTQVLLSSPVTDFGELGVLILYYTVVSQSGRGLAIAVAALTPAGIAAAAAIDVSTPPYALVLVAVQFAGACGLGAATRRWRRHLARRAAQLEHDREERERQAAAEERARIARELHDVVAHSLSVITVQAGAARTAAETTPDRIESCLLAIETVSREAWAEMRLFLDAAHGQRAEPSHPNLDHLEDLVERFEQAGLSVDLAVTGRARPLPAEVSLCAYRVVRESLTNVLRHAGWGGARVTLGFGDASVLVEIASAAPSSAPSPLAGGGHHGLAGMRERVRLIGGELSVADRAGAFTVSARLPLPAIA
jgi:signal transduction histidine kinase